MVTVMPKEDVRSEEEKILDIARYLKENEGNPQSRIASTVSHKLKVSSRTYGKTLHFIEDGVIQYRDDGEPFFATPFYQAQRDIVTKEKMTEAADRGVFGVVTETISNEARIGTERYLELGKAVGQAMFQWGAKHGYTPQQLLKMKPHSLVLDALDKRDKYDGLVEENRDLREQLGIYMQETDPVMRVRSAITLTNEFMKARVLAKIWGIPTQPITQHYVRMLYNYIGGMM